MNLSSQKNVLFVVTGVACVLFSYHLILDGLESKRNDYGYFFSESALFSIVWLLLIPFIFVIFQLKWFDLSNKKLIPLILLLVLSHITIYSILVWICSYVIFDHTFDIIKNFQYGFLEFFLILVTIYFCVSILFKYKYLFNSITQKSSERKKIENIVVSDANKKELIKINSILYIKANTPYIEIQTAQKKYLEHISLKHFLDKVNKESFIRVHKSAIVNIAHVESYISRNNGDYDITMSNQHTIRLSRNYANEFKTLMTNKIGL